MTSPARAKTSRERRVCLDGYPVELLVVRRSKRFFGLCMPVNLGVSGDTIAQVLERMLMLFAVWMERSSVDAARPVCIESDPDMLKRIQRSGPEVFELVK